MTIPVAIPTDIPGSVPLATTPTPSADPSSLYDVAIGGIGFVYANTVDTPNQRATAPFEKERVDQETVASEATLTNWWIKGQDSFHGGAGQLQLEPAVSTPYDHVRFDLSKNVDVFTPGQVTRLPDTSVISADSASAVVAVTVAGVDAVAYLTGSTVKLITSPYSGSPTVTNFTGITGSPVTIATDGQYVYAATVTDIWKLNPAAVGSPTKIATYPASATVGPVLGWAKSRLMLGVNGAVYEVDSNGSAVTLGPSQLKYQHPRPGYNWRCFGESPTAVLAAGDGGGQSTITQFELDNSTGAPVLTVAGDVAPMPFGERVLSLASSSGTTLIIGTTKGVRIGSYDTYTGALTYGPLLLLPTDPVIPAVALATRDRFVYVAGSAYDEGGLLRVDLSAPVDAGGRYPWAPDLIAPVRTSTPATGVCVTPAGRVVFTIPGTGVLLEGVGAGTGREAWLRTSRIRYGTTEPKLFKLGRVRGDFSNGTVRVDGQTPILAATLINVGPVTKDPDEFRLPSDPAEWLQVTFNLTGSSVVLNNYAVKALPGTRRQRDISVVLAISDTETARNGQRIRDALSSRSRLNQLEALDAAGDEVLFQEYTPAGVVSTIVVIRSVLFQQNARPTGREDIGGKVTVVMRTVES